MRRKAYQQLLRWKNGKTKQAMVVTGARQVGKSYLVREFGQTEYDHLVMIDLSLDNRARESFAQASDPQDLLLRISIATNEQMVPGKTLVFIDEVQECPQVVTFIKGLVDEGSYDYVLAGSLLGVQLQNVRSIPVGYMTELQLYPMDFEEFCWAMGLSDDAVAIAKASLAKVRSQESVEPVPDFVHERLMDLFHKYLLVGGMPDAVAAFVRDGTIDQARQIQTDIRRLYGTDIAKYAPEDRRLVIGEIYRLIPSELQSQNRRFRLSSIQGVKRFNDVGNDFLWLARAGVALPTYNVREPSYPLIMNDQRTTFKLFMSDVGLLVSTFRKRDSLDLIDGHAGTNMGGVYENFVAQELASSGFELYYFTKKNVGELDFVVEDGADRVIALEVKSGTSYRSHAALDHALDQQGYGISSAYVLGETNIEADGRVTYLPIYMAGWLGD
jgi:predicted AAA+ superfamily ATPase